MRKKRPILQMAEQYALAAETQANAAKEQVEIAEQDQRANTDREPTKEFRQAEVAKQAEKARASVAEDYVTNLYEAVALNAPKQEGEGMINYETQAREDGDIQQE